MSLQLPTVYAYRHDHLPTQRPYGVDVDENDWLWEGVGADLVTHHLRSAETRVYKLPELGGHAVYQCFCWQGKVLMTLGSGPHYAVFDPKTGKAEAKTVATPNPIMWYGTYNQDRSKVLIYDRGSAAVIILDGPDAAPRYVQSPYDGDLASGSCLTNGVALTFFTDPCRMVRFDSVSERFLDITDVPCADAGFSGRFEHRDVLYCADSAGGRLIPLDLKTLTWQEPIPTPEYGMGKTYGFIGGGFGFQGKGYFCLSNYAHRSRLDRKTGKIILPPEGTPMTVDGAPIWFLDRYLVFDPETRQFDFLIAPEQPDGKSLLCYAYADEKRFVITGVLQPWTVKPDHVNAYGPWLVVQSQPVDQPKPLGPFNFSFDRQKFLQAQGRAYPTSHSLFIPEEPHTPPTRNMVGPATAWPVGADQELARRAKVTDPKTYWGEVAARLVTGAMSDREKAACVVAHVAKHLYYNPIQVPQTFDPIAIHESHTARCGHSVAVTLAICHALGLQARSVGLTGHTVAEIFYDGAWHCADALFFGRRQPSRDGRVLSVDELKADPYFADAYPQDCFHYPPEYLMSQSGWQVLGYVFGVWGSEPYYSYYLGAPKAMPPTVPTLLPVQRLGGNTVRINWTRSLKYGEPEAAIDYHISVYADVACRDAVFTTITRDSAVLFDVPQANTMYYILAKAKDGHVARNAATWYPNACWNFVLVPPEQYGWYGVL